MGEDDEGRPNGIVRHSRREDYNPKKRDMKGAAREVKGEP